MYLSRNIAYEGRTYEVVGAIPGDVKMHAKPIGRGYVHLKEEESLPGGAPDRALSPPLSRERARGQT